MSKFKCFQVFYRVFYRVKKLMWGRNSLSCICVWEITNCLFTNYWMLGKYVKYLNTQVTQQVWEKTKCFIMIFFQNVFNKFQLPTQPSEKQRQQKNTHLYFICGSLFFTYESLVLITFFMAKQYLQLISIKYFIILNSTVISKVE